MATTRATRAHSVLTTAGAPAVSVLRTLIDEAYDRRSWHGPNLRGTLRGVTAAQAVWRPGAGRHNIWELVGHAAYWKYAVRRRLLGGTRGRFALSGSNFFPPPEEATPSAWRDSVDLLAREHAALCRAISGLEDRDLAKPVGRGHDTVGGLVRGIAAHDLYHAGQIQLIKRLMR